MADQGSIVMPDQLEDIRAAAKAKLENGDNNSIEVAEEPIEKVEIPPSVTNRNMIIVPGNCPDGQQRGADGVCRDVF